MHFSLQSGTNRQEPKETRQEKNTKRVSLLVKIDVTYD